MVPALGALDAVIDGSAEMSHGTPYYWQNKSQGLSFFTGVPFGMTSRELTAWVRYLGGQEIWDEVYDQFGVQGFLSGDTGTQAVITNADGSIDIFFGPKDPTGMNWIQTTPGKGWFVLFRFYGPLEAFFDKTWKLPDIEKVK